MPGRPAPLLPPEDLSDGGGDDSCCCCSAGVGVDRRGGLVGVVDGEVSGDDEGCCDDDADVLLLRASLSMKERRGGFPGLGGLGTTNSGELFIIANLVSESSQG